MLRAMQTTNIFAHARPTRVQIALWAGSLVGMLLLATRHWEKYSIGIFYDDAFYALLPRSLLYTAQYGNFFMPADFYRADFPFGFPLLLTPLAALFPNYAPVLRLVPLAASALSLSLLFWGWTRLTRNFSYWWGTTLVVLLAFSPLTILFARLLFSEAAFLLWSLIVYWLTERMLSGHKPSAVLLGAAAVAMVSTRTVGWIILATLFVYVILKLERAWRALSVVALSAGIVTAILILLTPITTGDFFPTQYLQPITGTYTTARAPTPSAAPSEAATSVNAFALLGQRAERAVNSFLFHLDFTDWLPARFQNQVRQFLDANGLNAFKLLPGILLLFVLAFGARRWYRRSGLTAFAIIVPPYLLTLLVWAWEGSRMYYPIQPQLLLILLLGVYEILEWLAHFLPRETARRTVQIFSLCGVSAILLASLAVNLTSSGWFVARTNRDAYSNWILTQTPKDAVILTGEPATDYLYAPRVYAPIPYSANTAQAFIEYLRAYNITYVIAPAPDNPRADLVAMRAPRAVQYHETVQQLVAQHILMPRYNVFDADVTIYQVDTTKVQTHIK